VGIGSAFAQVYPPQWRDWFDALSLQPGTQAEIEPNLTASDAAGVFLSRQRQMEYKPYRIISTVDGPGGLRRISVEGELAYKPGQFAFIWIPGVGEKPFSVALSKPVTFLVRERGPMTHALCSLKEGDTLYLRGVYGQGAEIAPVPKAWIVVGGTGLAVAPKLAEALSAAGKQVTTYIALADNTIAATEGSSDSSALFTQELSTAGDYRVVMDEGEIGRAVRLCAEEVSASAATAESALYTIGPFPFMDAAVKRAQNAGIPPEHIYISIETPTRCGVGLCGECACAGRLTCREGTFFS